MSSSLATLENAREFIKLASDTEASGSETERRLEEAAPENQRQAKQVICLLHYESSSASSHIPVRFPGLRPYGIRLSLQTALDHSEMYWLSGLNDMEMLIDFVGFCKLALFRTFHFT
jgi:hypothetical protein